MPDFNKYVRRYEGREITIGALLFILYIAGMLFSAAFLPEWAPIYPSHAFALAAVYFAGVRLSLVAGSAGFIGALLTGWSLPAAFLFLISGTIQSALGGSLLRTFNLDPLFRKRRDVLVLVGSIFASALVPGIATAIGYAIAGYEQSTVIAGYRFAGEIAVQTILLPFLIRWFGKPYFNRSFREMTETVFALLILVGLSLMIFVDDTETLIGIPLEYYLFPPLFWIALRMRPRFVTLALLIISIVAVVGVLSRDTADAKTLFDSMLLMTAVSCGFLLIAAQEEERRVNRTRTRSELATLENAIMRVQSESKAKNDFIAVLSHELRNPLAPVVSSIEYLRLSTDRPEDEMAALDVMSDRVDAIRHLLDDLLDVSRISEGKIKIKEEHVDLCEAIGRSILSTEHHREELHQTLSYKAPKTQIMVLGDRVRIEQIFSNLLTNASKYSNPGDEIGLSVSVEHDWVIIRIQDEGVGIAKDMQEKIFLPFHQIEQGERTTKGLGIGLSLVRKLVEMHGGNVSASSAGVGRGSTFTVRLPCLEAVAVLS